MKRRVIMLQKMVTHIECLKCAHENGCTLGYFGNVRLLSDTSEHVRFESDVRSEQNQTETGISDQKKKNR